MTNINFREWLVAFETVNNIMQHLAEESAAGYYDRRRGNHFDRDQGTIWAKMVVDTAKQVIDRSDLPNTIKIAASQMQRSTELNPESLGGKMSAKLYQIQSADQKNVVQNAAMYFFMYLPKKLESTEFFGMSRIDPEKLGVFIVQLWLTILDSKASDFYRKQKGKKQRLVVPATDIDKSSLARDDHDREYSYDKSVMAKAFARNEPDEEKPDVIPLKALWKHALDLVMNVREHIIGKIRNIHKSTTKALRNKVALLQTTTAIMRNLPAQMVNQEGDGSGDNKVYDRLKSMILDKESELDPADRSLMNTWANLKGKNAGGSDHIHRDIIAMSLWIADGERPNMKPRKALDDDHWFYKYAKQVA